ncbi:MAG: SoxR reducing system RseC family protein [Rhodocyclales bacterium]|nr:SoxR reducing system RseC family protein [Rhodocyclales bacterium]
MSRCDAVVIQVSGGEVVVELPARAAACGACKDSAACGEGLPGEGGVRRYRLANRIGARVGDHVQLGIADGMLWQASLASYVLPLLMALASAWVGQGWGGDGGAVAGLLLGLACGLWLLRRRELRARRDPAMISLQFPTQEIRFEDMK